MKIPFIFSLSVLILSCNNSSKSDETNQKPQQDSVYSVEPTVDTIIDSMYQDSVFETEIENTNEVIDNKTIQSNNGDTITTKSGLRYIITKKNPKGVKPQKGNQIQAHYTGSLVNGKIFDSSRKRGQPLPFTIGAGQVIAGWDEGFSYLREGEQATLIIPPSIGYGSRDMGDIPPNSTLIFDVELVKVVQPMNYTKYSGAGKDTITTKSGLKYIIIDKGNTNFKARKGQMAQLYYAGYFTNGKMFDGNFSSGQPFSVQVDNPPVIEGWKEMILLMNKGMKVKAIIPPHLAYGANGYPNVIPPNSTLIFDMFLENLQ
ncbi:MAG: FKBP-type peptidyl-prolyl cis-trans isomerase [Bacteroidia bacterium]